jgi:hypothetical protein
MLEIVQIDDKREGVSGGDYGSGDNNDDNGES